MVFGYPVRFRGHSCGILLRQLAELLHLKRGLHGSCFDASPLPPPARAASNVLSVPRSTCPLSHTDLTDSHGLICGRITSWLSRSALINVRKTATTLQTPRFAVYCAGCQLSVAFAAFWISLPPAHVHVSARLDSRVSPTLEKGTRFRLVTHSTALLLTPTTSLMHSPSPAPIGKLVFLARHTRLVLALINGYRMPGHFLVQLVDSCPFSWTPTQANLVISSHTTKMLPNMQI